MKLFLTAFLIFLAASSAKSQPKQIDWLNDFNQAKQIAANSARPMLLDFTASWCKPCREMETDFWARADVSEIAGNFVCVKIDLDANPKLADKYGVSSLPDIILTDSWGGALDFHRGFGRNGVAEILEKLRGVPKNFGEIQEASRTLAADKKNADALLQIADFYHEKKFFYASAEFYSRFLKAEKNPAKREIPMLKLAADYSQVGWNKEAKDVLEKFKREFPNSPQNER